MSDILHCMALRAFERRACRGTRLDYFGLHGVLSFFRLVEALYYTSWHQGSLEDMSK